MRGRSDSAGGVRYWRFEEGIKARFLGQALEERTENSASWIPTVALARGV